jgi:hypothetical protein
MAVSTINTASLGSGTVAPLATSLSTIVGSAPSYACRAWVNFNGTGTVAIRGSGNVSSITDNGTGDYTVNFTTAMPDANYCVNGTTEGSACISENNANILKTTTQLRIYAFASSTGGAVDRTQISVTIFR